jgi:uncharacterized membrane protein
MKKAQHVTRGPGGCLLAIITAGIGLCLIPLAPVGTVVGVLLLLVAPFLTRKVSAVWRCRSCGAMIPRG